jgi:phage tail sheath protein FI
MPQYLAPGVYVEEVSSGIKPIAGVSTSTAGFVGVVADDVVMPARPGQFAPAATGKNAKPGPPQPVPYPVADALKARLVTSWEAFRTSFGDIQAGNFLLAHAVYGFFNNGGSRCWVVRISAPTSPAADAPPATVDTAAIADVTAALTTFAAIDEIAIVAAPGATSDAVQNAVLDHCENEHLQDRFAVLDGRVTEDATRDAIQGGTRDSSYGAIYHPRITVADPVSGSTVALPPSGHIAGVYARVDAERGVHKAPANEVIRGALDVSVLVSRADQAGLNPEDINVIRKFGGNVTIFGAHTLAGKEDPEWRYISVRRLFLFLRDSLNSGLQWTVFEPNDPALWGKLRRNVSAFLTNVWRSGALLGTTPADAFFVRCDDTTNPPDVRALGQVATEIGVAVVNPAEFVVFRLSQWAGPGPTA